MNSRASKMNFQTKSSPQYTKCIFMDETMGINGSLLHVKEFRGKCTKKSYF